MVSRNRSAFMYMCLSFVARFLIYIGLSGPVVNLSATILYRQLSLGPWELARGTAVFIGASCIVVEVAQLFVPIIN